MIRAEISKEAYEAAEDRLPEAHKEEEPALSLPTEGGTKGAHYYVWLSPELAWRIMNVRQSCKDLSEAILRIAEEALP